jgi:hypothetical protein
VKVGSRMREEISLWKAIQVPEQNKGWLKENDFKRIPNIDKSDKTRGAVKSNQNKFANPRGFAYSCTCKSMRIHEEKIENLLTVHRGNT